MLYTLLAHAGEDHAEAAETTRSLGEMLAHLPVWQALLLAVVVVLAAYALLSLLKLKPLSRIFGLLPLVVAIAIFFIQHQPQVSGLLLSAGFVVVFVLAFAMLKVPNQ